MECAGWGGVLSVGAQVNGVEGVVIDGPARDIDEARALGFPVYGRSPIARTARGRAYEIDFNCEIRIGAVGVIPGDVVFARFERRRLPAGRPDRRNRAPGGKDPPNANA